MADAKPKGQKASEVAELKKQMELMQSMLETQRKEIEAMRAKKNATKAASPRKAASPKAAATPTRRRSHGAAASPADRDAEPSRVLHVRDLPADATLA